MKGEYMERDATLLRIFVGESDKVGHRPLYEAIVQANEAYYKAANPAAPPRL